MAYKWVFSRTLKNGKVRGKTNRCRKIIPQSRCSLRKSSLTIVDKFRFGWDTNATKVIRPQRTTRYIWNNVTRQVWTNEIFRTLFHVRLTDGLRIPQNNIESVGGNLIDRRWCANETFAHTGVLFEYGVIRYSSLRILGFSRGIRVFEYQVI